MQAVPTQLERATAGGGEAGAAVRGHDWSRTPLGPMTAWSAPLQYAVATCLSTAFPMVVNWGRSLIQIYNDAAVGVFGSKHPEAIGQPARVNFPEFWEHSTVEAIVERTFATALPFHATDERLLLNRHGLLEETYFTFSLSPILDGDGTVLGILNTFVETTARVLGERRMATLRALAERAVRARTAAEACDGAVAALSGNNPRDIRFSLLYLTEADAQSARLAGAAGIEAGSAAAPRTLALAPSTDEFVWPLEEVLRTHQAVLVDDLQSKIDLGRRPSRITPPRNALVLPLVRSNGAGMAGMLVVGLSPRLPLDGPYRGFLELVALQVGAGIASAEASEEASERVKRLAEIDQAKNVFYGNISHEFRTPLTLMLGPVDDLLREDDGQLTVAQREKLMAIRRSALRLLRLVSGLLDLARIEAGSLDVEGEPVDLASLTREVVSSFDSAMAAAGLRLEVDCPPLPREVRMDRTVWEAIVLNLVSNGLKYTPKGSVTVSLHAVDDRVRLAVRDTGVGIPSTVLPHVFERFYRSREPQARSIEGTGIGLALVREFVRALGGDVGVESTPGVGSTFTVDIPLVGAPSPSASPTWERTAAADGGASALVQEAKKWVERKEPAPALPTVAAGAVSRRRILVVEDNADLRRYLAQILESGLRSVVGRGRRGRPGRHRQLQTRSGSE